MKNLLYVILLHIQGLDCKNEQTPMHRLSENQQKLFYSAPYIYLNNLSSKTMNTVYRPALTENTLHFLKFSLL